VIDSHDSENKKQSGTEHIQKELLAAWVQNRMVTVSLLGIRVGVDDVPTLGAIAIIIATIWLYFSARRENCTIGLLLYDHRDADKSKQWLVFHAINSCSVFTNVVYVDASIRDFKQLPDDSRIWFVRLIYRALYFLPGFSLVLALFFDLMSVYCLASAFRDNDEPIYKQLSIRELWTYVGWWLASLVALVAVAILNYQTYDFANATEEALHKFLKYLDPQYFGAKVPRSLRPGQQPPTL
jgi:hypothetical protein